MLNKILKGVNSQGRLNIPNDLLELVGIYPNQKAALCYHKKGVMLRPLTSLKDRQVIKVVKLDHKGRFVFPIEMMEKSREKWLFHIYVLNGEVIIEEVVDEIDR